MRHYATQPIGTVPRLRQLRREAPEPERRLLRALREALPELKWRHQAPLGPYKADVLCFAERLVIEVDGDTHAGTVEYDAARTRLMEQQGYTVLRFTNVDVMQNLEGVLTSISRSLQAHRVNSTPCCSARAGGTSGPMREKVPQARAGENSAAKLSSPFRRASAAPSLSHGEREK